MRAATAPHPLLALASLLSLPSGGLPASPHETSSVDALVDAHLFLSRFNIPPKLHGLQVVYDGVATPVAEQFTLSEAPQLEKAPVVTWNEPDGGMFTLLMIDVRTPSTPTPLPRCLCVDCESWLTRARAARRATAGDGRQQGRQGRAVAPLAGG